MATSRIEHIDDIGTIRITKKRGVKRISLRLHSSGEIRVTQPFYLPFSAGTAFAKSQSGWVLKQMQKQVAFSFYDGMKIGKTFTVQTIPSETVATRIKKGAIIIKYPEGIADAHTIKTVKNAIKRALKNEATAILPDRLNQLATHYGYTYKDVTIKPMKVRWGACSNVKDITLNCYLMMLPWSVIDYVLLHELAHTKHMHHGEAFWHEVASTTPNYKDIKKNLKELQPQVHSLYV